MDIIGAGPSGLLAGALNSNSTIYESAKDLPFGHKAILRCRSDRISLVTGISFKKVTVHKGLWVSGKDTAMSPRHANMYSSKVTNSILPRSIFNLKTETRYIPPPDFLNKLANRCGKIRTNHQIKKITEESICFGKRNLADKKRKQPLISTMPMPVLAALIQYKPILEIDFSNYTKPILVTTARIMDCETYMTIYYPGPETPVYRASLNGDELIIESIGKIDEGHIKDVLKSFGLWTHPFKMDKTNQKHRRGKIIPIPEKTRRKFIYDMTIKYNIYSLGRYATWRPNVMLDDIVDDVFAIERMIDGGDYQAHKQNNRKEK